MKARYSAVSKVAQMVGYWEANLAASKECSKADLLEDLWVGMMVACLAAWKEYQSVAYLGRWKVASTVVHSAAKMVDPLVEHWV